MQRWLLAIIALMIPACAGAKPQSSPLAEASPAVLASPSKEPPAVFSADPALLENLESHVTMLAETIGPRNTRVPEGYKRAELYLAERLGGAGYKVQRQTYTAGNHQSVNLWAEKPGDAEILVIGAHYDSLASGTPGADDNASGCAALLELARLLKDEPLGPTVRFVFFANEEPPYFQTEAMGSLVYARRCQSQGEKLLGMISLECVGFYLDSGGSQHFPPGVTGYPEQGNFAAFVSDLFSKAFMERCLAGFQQAGVMPAEGLAAPSLVEGVSWSDHWSFSKCGYPALMITDTAPFRNPHYHLDSDTPETLDFAKLAAVVEGTRQLVLGL